MKAPKNRKGNWIQTYTGKAFWPLDPRPEEICIEDIAHSLSNQCRFGGHCKYFYSVAEHSIYVSRFCDKENALWGLLHDAVEAYLVDLPRPIKYCIPEYKKIEERLEKLIAERFYLQYPAPEQIREIDNSLLLKEKERLMGISPYEWDLEAKPIGVFFELWYPQTAEDEFLDEFRKIVKNLQVLK